MSEYSHFLITFALIVAVAPTYRRGSWWIPQLLLCIEILLVGLYPIVSAQRIANGLTNQLAPVFGKTSISQVPFSYLNLFSTSPTLPNPTQYTYFKSLEQTLTLDFYPTAVKNAPIVITIHGGGWDSGNNKQLESFNRVLANSGVAVAALNYSLAPKYLNPKQIDDVKHCIEFLTKNSATLNINTNNIVLLGRSAGGQIALQTAYSQYLPQIKGVVALYTPADMIWGYTHAEDNAVLNAKTLITQYMGGTLASVPEKYAQASALSHVKAGIVPTLMIHGRQDNMVAFEHNLHLIEKLKQVHAKYFLLDLPWATHGADYNVNGPTGQLCSYTILYFINSITEP